MLVAALGSGMVTMGARSLQKAGDAAKARIAPPRTEGTATAFANLGAGKPCAFSFFCARLFHVKHLCALDPVPSSENMIVSLAAGAAKNK